MNEGDLQIEIKFTNNEDPPEIKWVILKDGLLPSDWQTLAPPEDEI